MRSVPGMLPVEFWHITGPLLSCIVHHFIIGSRSRDIRCFIPMSLLSSGVRFLTVVCLWHISIKVIISNAFT